MSAAQLGRGQAEKQKPTLKDFRESGSFEQDADVVIFPYRAEYYGIMEDEKGNTTEGKVEMIIAKHRNGGLGNPTMNFVSRLAKFESAQQQHNRPVPHPDQRIDPSVRRNEDFLENKSDVPY
jgi:replicative DNA helicase